jgi:glucose/mannose-6-phosphate isomerase
MMDQLIARFDVQLKEALAIAKEIELNVKIKDVQHIVISGLGGSGIGGSIAQELLATDCPLPVLVTKDYSLPAYVGKNTLVIACSYSGNTEETLSALEIAYKKKAQIICISSGGKMAEWAFKKKKDFILIPGGMPPRSCVGYSLVQLLSIFKKLKLTKMSVEKDVLESISLLKKEQKNILKQAEKVAKHLADKTPVIYAAAGTEGVAIRFRQQINENGKQLCWHHVLPEMNHNELVAWRDKNPNLAVIFLRHPFDHPRTQMRMKLNQQVIKKCTPHITEIHSKGESVLARQFYLIHLTDWVSFFLSKERNYDCVEVKVIDWLKAELAKA